MTIIGLVLEDIIIEGDQRKGSYPAINSKSLPSIHLSSFLPLFCHLIWKEESEFPFLYIEMGLFLIWGHDS